MDVNIAHLLYVLLALGISITLHEFMHAYVSNRLGDSTAYYSGRLTLNPLAHVDPLLTVLLPLVLFLSGSGIIFGAAKPVPFNPRQLKYGEIGSALVALAGPLTNFVAAVFIGLWLRWLPVVPAAADFFAIFAAVNIGFFLFNMIPFPPLDGSRVLYAFMPESVRDIMNRIESFGLLAVGVFIFALYPLISPVIARLFNLIMGALLPGF